MTRGATLFSGGGGVEALLKKRIQFVHAVEYDPAIAAVYRANHGDHIQVADVCDVDYSLWGHLDYLHASPVCKEYSRAKTGRAEGESDIASALAVVRCLEQTSPRVFTLENVGEYQHGEAYRLICAELSRVGYMWHAEVLNSADFGVPQTRRRLILRAVKDALLPGLAVPDRWVGWYAAIEDLIPTLPPSQFAKWQLARLEAGLDQSLYADTTLFINKCASSVHAPTSKEEKHIRRSTRLEPAPTLVAQASWRAFIVSNGDNKYGDGLRSAAEPCHSITAQANGRTRAFLMRSANTQQEWGKGFRDDDEPAYTVATGDMHARAWLSAGRVVRMTPRALARFQSLPDAFVLPDKAGLACTVIGNCCPSLMMQKIVEPLL